MKNNKWKGISLSSQEQDEDCEGILLHCEIKHDFQA